MSCHFLTRSATEAPQAPRAAGPPDELTLKRELSDICHKTGIADWQVMLKAIFDWIAEANGMERVKRLEVLNQLVEGVKIHAKELDLAGAPPTQSQVAEVGEKIRKLLIMLVENLLPIK